jgi:hypothetical protein
MTEDQINYLLGLRSRPMTDAERLLDDARRVVDAYRPRTGDPLPGVMCARGDA